MSKATGRLLRGSTGQALLRKHTETRNNVSTARNTNIVDRFVSRLFSSGQVENQVCRDDGFGSTVVKCDVLVLVSGKVATREEL